MDTLAEEASKELAKQLSIDNLTKSTMKEFQAEKSTCLKGLNENTTLTAQTKQNTETVDELIATLKGKDAELQASFEKIDQLQEIVNKVKETYNQVAENLDQMEKAVSASTPFRLGNRKGDIPIQPYFPPPNHVDIFKTEELFK